MDTATTLTSVADGAWHHAVLTKNSSAVTLYVDGALAATTPIVGTTNYGSTPSVMIGRDYSGATYFNGAIDDVAIYPSALTSTQVAAHRAAGVTAPSAPAWTAPSVAFNNGEVSLAFYGGRPFSATGALAAPANYKTVHDTQSDRITVGLHSRTMGPIAGTTGNQVVDGPKARWVGQQVLLRPVYDSSLRRSTPEGTNTYDKLNRLTSSGSFSYSYDGASNRLTQSKGAEAVSYSYNNANQLTAIKQAISIVGTNSGAMPSGSTLAVPLPAATRPGDQIIASITGASVDSVVAPGYSELANVTSGVEPAIWAFGTATGQSSIGRSSFTVNLPAGIQTNDQILLAVTQTKADTATAAGYTEVATASSGTNVTDTATTLFRRTAVGGETQLTVTGSPGAVQTAAVSVYRNVDPANPIGALATAGTPTSNTVTVPSLTPSELYDWAVVVHGAANNSPASWTAPLGMTERVQNNTQSLRSVGLADELLTSTAATGSLTSTLSTAANLAGIGLTLRPVRVPRTVVFRRTAAATDTHAQFTLSAGTSAAASVAVYRGVDPISPIDALTTATGSRTNNLSFASLTAATAGELLVIAEGAVNSGSPGTWSGLAGATQRAAATVGQIRSSGLADKTLTSAGATGPLTVTLSTSQPAWANVAGAAFTLRPASPTYTYDANGNLTGSSDGGALSYDTGDRTTGITPAGGTATTFTYRGAGQTERATMSPAARVSSPCTPIAGCRPATTTTLASTATFEHTRLGISAETDGTTTTYFVRDPGGGLLAQHGPTVATYYYLLDGHGSVVGLSDTAGNIAATYGYDPYGQLTSMTGGSAAVNNPFRYVGAYQDASGLYKMGARYYDPSLGRWTQQDPLFDPFDPGQWNRYTYAGNDPINHLDLDGLKKKKHWWDNVDWGRFACGAAVAVGVVAGVAAAFAGTTAGAIGLTAISIGASIAAPLFVDNQGGVWEAAASNGYFLYVGALVGGVGGMGGLMAGAGAKAVIRGITVAVGLVQAVGDLWNVRDTCS